MQLDQLSNELQIENKNASGEQRAPLTPQIQWMGVEPPLAAFLSNEGKCESFPVCGRGISEKEKLEISFRKFQ